MIFLLGPVYFLLMYFNDCVFLISLSQSHRGYVLENGQIVMEGKGQELLQNPQIKEAYLGM